MFARAQREHRLVLLDLEAVWCHWCHVMAETTYRDPKVVRLIGEHFIAVRVDQDAHPDLANRYEEYGWPATIMFAADGRELIRRRGYLPPQQMAAILAAVVADPTPGPSVVDDVPTPPAQGALRPAVQRELGEHYLAAYDQRHGGFGRKHKFLQAELIEWALVKAREGDARHAEMARKTLDAALQLIDPVWGGSYQYSDSLDWRSPHFEKIIWSQVHVLRSYAAGYAVFGESRYLTAARQVAGYLLNFLRSPEGAFYTSQDADVGHGVDGHRYYTQNDAGRRKLGIPRIDRNTYPRENGWVAAALLDLYAVSGDQRLIDAARQALDWITKHRALPGGGFRHGEDRENLFLGDTLAMGQAYLSLYASTGERAALAQAEQAARFMAATFRHPEAGLMTAPPRRGAVGVFGRAVRQLDENVDTIRFAIRLHHYTGDDAYRRLAEHALRYAASPGIVGSGRMVIGVVLADREHAETPLHVTIVGPKGDADAQALWLAALRYPALYKRAEWWDRREGPLRHMDVAYPTLARPAAFACSARACSAPIHDATKLAAALDRLRRAAGDAGRNSDAIAR